VIEGSLLGGAELVLFESVPGGWDETERIHYNERHFDVLVELSIAKNRRYR
jgi:hypothetical protein